MYYTYAVLLALGFDGDYISDPSDRGLVSLKVTLAMCGSLASTVSDSENNDDAFVGPIASHSLPRKSVSRPKKAPHLNGACL